MTELFNGELVNVGNGGGVEGPGDEVDLVALDVLNNHHVLLGKEMEGQITDSLSEDRLLEEDDVHAGLDDLFDELDNVLTLFLEQSVDRCVVTDANVAVHVGLGGGEGELNEADLGVLYLSGATSESVGGLVDETETVNELRVVNGTAELLGDRDVAEVDVSGGLLVNDLEDGIDGHGGEEVTMVGNNLGGERGDGVLDKLLAVVEVDGLGHAFDNFKGFPEGDFEAVRNSGGVDTLVHKVLAGAEEGTGHHDNGGGSVTSLNILGLGDFNQLWNKMEGLRKIIFWSTYHFCGRVDNFHLTEDGGSVVSDNDLAFGVLDLDREEQLVYFALGVFGDLARNLQK